MSEQINIVFKHGLGDCANFAHALSLWTKRGFKVNVETTPDKAVMFQAAGCSTDNIGGHHHGFGHPGGYGAPHWVDSWLGNKTAHNLMKTCMPEIGDEIDPLWNELLRTKLSLESFVSEQSKAEIDAFVDGCQGPLILLHTRANTSSGQKNFSPELEYDTYKELIRRVGGTVFLLDWDNRVKKVNNRHIRHIYDDFRGLSLPDLWYLMTHASLVVGVDSGPLHFARFTDTPALGVWKDHKPAQFAVPRAKTLHLSPVAHCEWNYRRRAAFNIVHENVTAGKIAELAEKLLSKPATEVAFDEFLGKLFVGDGSFSVQDRSRTFGVMLAEMRKRECPRIAETGCMRREEDFTAGMSTYLFSWFLQLHGSGLLHSVDLDKTNVKNAWLWTQQFEAHTSVREMDSVNWLKWYSDMATVDGHKLDLLYLDSMDTDLPGAAEHCLNEVRAGLEALREDGVIAIDDTPWIGGKWTGKGETAVPYLLDKGFRILEAGYQVVMKKGA